MGAFCSTLRPGAVRDYDPLPRVRTNTGLALRALPCSKTQGC